MSLQLLSLGLVFVVLAAINDGLYGMAAGSMRRWIDRSPRRSEAVGATSGLLMIGLGVRLALTGRKDRPRAAGPPGFAGGPGRVS